MPFTPALLLSILKRLPAAHRYVVAYSGGCDSAALLHAMASLRHAYGADLLALHVNHGLQAASVCWAEHCQAVCRGLGVELQRIDLALHIGKGESPEAAAREARYQAIQAHMREGDMLLTAHHQDDQAETLLLQLLRGSGPAGLAGMAELKACPPAVHARPLLGFSREELAAYARDQGLSWVEDSSNLDTRFDRNFLRREVMPLLASRWPALSRTLARSAAHCAEAQLLIEELAQADLARLGGDDAEALPVSGLKALSLPRRRVLLRNWIQGRGFQLPDAPRLECMAREAIEAGADRMPLIRWPGAEVRRYRDRLYLMTPLSDHDPGLVLPWDGASPLVLPAGLGTLRADLATGGMDPEKWSAGGLQVSFRQGGEQCRPLGRGHGRSLKKLFQERGLPPWERDRVPLISLNGQLAAVADLWVCEPFAAAEDQPGIRICWEH